MLKLPITEKLNILWNNLTTCGGVFFPGSRHYRRVFLINVMLLAAMGVFGLFTLLNLLVFNDFKVAVVDLVAFVSALTALIYFRFSRDVKKSGFITTVIIGLALLSFLYLTQHYEYSLFWLATFPPFAYFLNGTKRGTFAVALLFIPVFITLILNLGVWEPAPYDQVSIYNISVAFIALVVLVYFYEKSRHQAQVQLQAIRNRDATEKERSRLLREMHDGLGAQLTTALYAARNEQASVEEVADYLQLALEDLRIMMDSMQAFDGDVATLLGQLRYRLERRIQQAGLELSWQVEDLPNFPNMTPQDALNLQRLMQEALVNTIKHAKARKVSLMACMIAPKVLKIQIKDDGCGFDEQLVEFTGRGLSNLHYRAVELNAKLTLNSQPGQGCCIELLVPVSKTSNNE
ncbi:sensor histidine kinase [Marinospirillum insulare]|uniref:Histidine kinase domain-containing protein n=1 Tax=Marinospirillum insulare TaxID=217169 RepID=A0ABQ5ZUJ7_9GAMM|nr:ATP-binding protein [Marinospirillum insulare]GLR63092.1 hypothetical protein GCM10007878_05270 [Marinospirillum insulare]